MDKEMHLFIIWENGRHLEEPILKDIASKFKILQVIEMSWQKKEFASRLAKFYGKNLPKGCKKQKECGDGAFLMIFVEDDKPCYESGQNVNMIDNKGLYRRWFRGENFIHCSDCRHEGLDNLKNLLNLSLDEFYQKYGDAEWNGKITRIKPKEAEQRNGWLQNVGLQLLQNMNIW